MPFQFKKDKLQVSVFADRESLGKAAAAAVSKKIKSLLETKQYISLIFAAAPSQNEFLQTLAGDPTIPWSRINAFHMDEYLGLPGDAPQLFGTFLTSRLFSKVPFRSVNYINPDSAAVQEDAAAVQKECERYTGLLRDNPPDIVCMGIGENTHIAFNDPFLADFADPQSIKMVSLDPACRQQQVNDGCFKTLEEVPRSALTLTIPVLLKAPFIYCMVPGSSKASAIRHTLTEPVSEEYPSTILRTHGAAFLFIDEDSYSTFKNNP